MYRSGAPCNKLSDWCIRYILEKTCNRLPDQNVNSSFCLLGLRTIRISGSVNPNRIRILPDWFCSLSYILNFDKICRFYSISVNTDVSEARNQAAIFSLHHKKLPKLDIPRFISHYSKTTYSLRETFMPHPPLPKDNVCYARDINAAMRFSRPVLLSPSPPALYR